jgi:hypothetical protein
VGAEYVGPPRLRRFAGTDGTAVGKVTAAAPSPR